MKLHTGKTFAIPFEELVIFSTNLEPENLMDPAFLRRLPYKIEVGPPTRDLYRKIFDSECAKQNVEMTDETFDIIVHKVTVEKGLEFAAYHPRFMAFQTRLWQPTDYARNPTFRASVHRLRNRQSSGAARFGKQAACGNIRPDGRSATGWRTSDASNFSAPGSSNLRIKLEKRVQAALELPLDLLA